MSFLVVVLLLLLSLVRTIDFGCDLVSVCVLAWICVWCAMILVLSNLSWCFGDRSLTFLLAIEFR